jgi:hypothetical protein
MLDRALGLGVVARPGGELAEAHGAQLAAERLLGDRDPELLPQPLAQVDEAPAHHAVDGGRRAALDRRRQRRPVRVVQPGWLAGGLAVAQPARALGVEPQHPVADDLQRHPADPGRLGPRRPVVDRRQRQQPARLRGVLRPPRRGTQCRRVEVVPERDGHGEPPPFAISNQKTAARGIPSRVTASGTWYKLLTGMADPPWRKPVAGWRGPSVERSASSWCDRARVSVGSGTPEAPPIAPGAARPGSAPSRVCILGVLRRRRGGRERCRFSTRAARGSTYTRIS